MDQCGCSESETFIPCSLCAGGEETALPEKKIIGIAGLGFNYLEHTCGAVSRVALSITENSQLCRLARQSTQLCGCKSPVENACAICGGGDRMSNPFQDIVFNFDAISNIYPADLGDEVDVFKNRKISCKVADSRMAVVYT